MFICTDVNIQMITIHLHIYVLISLICTNTNNRIIVNHPHCKNHPKSLPYVNPVCLQSHTTIHINIHPYALVHKNRQERSPYYFHYILYIRISSTLKHILSHLSQKLHKFMKTLQHHVTLLKTQDGDVPTTINVLVNSFRHYSTLIAVQVHYDAI